MARLTPKIDIAFKRIFGVEENKDLLMSFINSVVSEEDRVADLTILNPYNPQNFANDKLSILDVKARGENGKLFNIEIQIANEGDYDKRALFYWAKLYTEQLQSGEDYSKLAKAIGIHILNFHSITGDDKYHNCFHVTEKDTGKRYFKDLELHTIELDKFESNVEQLQDLIGKIKSALDVWLAFLTKHQLINKDALPPALNNHELKKALGVLEIMNLTKEEQYAYEDREKWLRIEANTLKKAKEDGIEEGRAEGIEEGREVRENEIAINMLKQNLDHSLISSVTGLSADAILKLKND